MGIKKELFLVDSCDIFICPVCQEVASDPVLASCCEATFCSTCFNDTMANGTDSCPGCNQKVSNGIKSIPLQKQLKQFYQSLRLKCQDCDRKVTIDTMDDHGCSGKVFTCTRCGFKDHIPKGSNHDCIVWFKIENERLSKEIRELRSLFQLFSNPVQREKLKKNDSSVSDVSKSDLNVSTNPIGVVFNEEETFALEEIRKCVAMAIIDIVKSTDGDLSKNNSMFKSAMRSYIAGKWSLIPKFPVKNIKFSPHIVPNTFCSFTYRDNHYIAYKISQGKFPKIDSESVLIRNKLEQLEHKWRNESYD